MLDSTAFDRKNISRSAVGRSSDRKCERLPRRHRALKRQVMRRIRTFVPTVFLLAIATVTASPGLWASGEPPQELALSAANTSPTVPQAGRRMLLLDGDADEGDSMGFLLALNSPEVDVKAVTVVAGMTLIPQGLKNELQMASLAGR